MLKSKEVKKPKLFTAKLVTRDLKKSKVNGYTHAFSFKQAMRNLSFQYPAKDYQMESMKDEVTGLSFTRQEWMQIARRGERD